MEEKTFLELFLDVPPEVNALIENADCKQPAAATDWYLLSPEFIWNTNANTNTNVTSSQMVRLHDKTSARQSYVHCSVLFCSPASAFETRLSGMSVSERGCEIYLCCWAGTAAGRLRDFVEQRGCVSLCSKLSQSYCSNIAQYHYSKVPH